MKINKFLYLLIYLFFVNALFAQNKQIDSLKNLLRTNKEDTNKVGVLNKIADKLLYVGNYETSLLYANQAKIIAEKLEFKKGLANAYNLIGVIYWRQGNYSLSLKNHFTALKIRKEVSSKHEMAASYNAIGTVYDALGNYPEALKNYFASLRIEEEIADKEGIAISFNNIGNTYQHQIKYPEALKNHFAALKIEEEIHDKEGIGYSYNNIGNIYALMNKLPQALKNHFAALKIREENGDKRGIAWSYNNIGSIYDMQGNYTEALKNQFAALKILEAIKDKEGIESAYVNIGATYKDLKKYKEAEDYNIKGLNLAKEIGDLEDVENANFTLSEIYEITGKYKQALENYKDYVVARDSILNEESDVKSLQIANQYESEKKEKEIAILKVDQTIAEAQHKRKQLIYAAVILIVMIMAFFIVGRQRLKSKKDKVIFEKQEALLQAEKQKAEDDLVHAKNLLNNYTENLIEKNRTVEELQFEIEKLKGLKAAEIYKEKIDNLDDLNNATILTNEDWEKFKELFEQVYKGFFIRLKDKLPNLTNAEIRLMSLIKLNLDTKQMANMLGVSPDTITKTRYRLRKKIDLGEQQDLDVLVQSI